MNFLFLILSTSILMSFLILLALALFSFFPEQFSGKTRYFIWIIILIGLIIPVRPMLGDGLITIELPRQTESDVFVEETATSSTPATSGKTYQHHLTKNPKNRKSPFRHKKRRCYIHRLSLGILDLNQ